MGQSLLCVLLCVLCAVSMCCAFMLFGNLALLASSRVYFNVCCTRVQPHRNTSRVSRSTQRAAKLCDDAATLLWFFGLLYYLTLYVACACPLNINCARTQAREVGATARVCVRAFSTLPMHKTETGNVARRLDLYTTTTAVLIIKYNSMTTSATTTSREGESDTSKTHTVKVTVDVHCAHCAHAPTTTLCCALFN